MPHIHNTQLPTEFQDFFSSDEKAGDIIINLYKKFLVCKKVQIFNEIKVKGFKPSDILLCLLSLPFFNLSSISGIYKSKIKVLKSMQKDAYYRLKNDSIIDWRSLLYSFSKRALSVIKKYSESDSTLKGSPKCLIVDDTTFHKKGKNIEYIGRVYDHVLKRSILGFKCLVLSYWDGKSFFPVDFSLHTEKGKNKKMPYGLRKKDLKKRFSKQRDVATPSIKRCKELTIKKTENALNLIRRAVKHGFRADYVLMDKWFVSELIITEIRKIRKGILHLVAACKMDKRRYIYCGQSLTAKGLLNKLKTRKKRSRKLSAFYIEVLVTYKGVPLKLFFNRFFCQKHWELIVSTDTSLKFSKAIEIYTTRWSVEVFFKEGKQYLRLGRSQSRDFDGQIADITISMIQYTILSLQKRFLSYETIGGIFKNIQDKMLEYTLAERLWQLFVMLQEKLAQILDIDVCELISKLLSSDENHRRLKFFFIFLEQENSLNNVNYKHEMVKST